MIAQESITPAKDAELAGHALQPHSGCMQECRPLRPKTLLPLNPVSADQRLLLKPYRP
jgi:hypothetical protein